jgi:hypothetical protein
VARRDIWERTVQIRKINQITVRNGSMDMSKDCWEKEKNADKRPKGWKSQMQGEHASAAVDQDSGT